MFSHEVHRDKINRNNAAYHSRISGDIRVFIDEKRHIRLLWTSLVYVVEIRRRIRPVCFRRRLYRRLDLLPRPKAELCRVPFQSKQEASCESEQPVTLSRHIESAILIIDEILIICYDLFNKDQVLLTLGLVQLAWMGFPSELIKWSDPTFGCNLGVGFDDHDAPQLLISLNMLIC